MLFRSRLCSLFNYRFNRSRTVFLSLLVSVMPSATSARRTVLVSTNDQRITQLRHEFSSLLDLELPESERWLNIVSAKDRDEHERCRFVGRYVLNSEVWDLAHDMWPREQPHILTQITKTAISNTNLAIIASLIFSPGTNMIADEVAPSVRYRKHDADTLQAFAHVLASEPNGNQRLMQWVKDVFTKPLIFFRQEMDAAIEKTK